MLVGSIQSSLEHAYYPPVVSSILEYLLSLPLAELETGRHELPFLPVDKAWFVILEYHTEAENLFQPEVHHYHSDLQLVLSGQEKMAWCMDDGSFSDDGIYLEHRDLQYYQRHGMRLNYFTAEEGYFYLFTPNTVHFTNISSPEPSEVRKLVVKIHNDLLVKRA